MSRSNSMLLDVDTVDAFYGEMQVLRRASLQVNFCIFPDAKSSFPLAYSHCVWTLTVW